MIRRSLGHAVGVTTVAEFLRARREQLQPAEVGLADNGRRRTPGLRREEVATLAGVSIDYLVRLEQGRDTRPSPSVIAALADALLLDEEQRRQLYYEVLLLPDVDEQRLVFWLPADDATSTAFTRAGASDVPTSPPHLRVIG